MVFNSLGHCTCPIIKYNTITHCPMLVDCCVGFVWLVSLHRSSQSLILDPADVTCIHIFIWIAKGMEVNKALQPCIPTHTPSYAVPPQIQMVWLIVVFILLSLFPLPSPRRPPIFTSKWYELGVLWSIKWFPSILHPRQSIFITDWLLCVLI